MKIKLYYSVLTKRNSKKKTKHFQDQKGLKLLGSNIASCGYFRTMDVPSNDLEIIKEALKEHAESSFKKYNLLKELNLSKDEYNPLKNLSLLKNIIIYK